METIPRKVVLAVALILVVLAGLGVYQGWRRSGLGDTDTGEGGLPTLTAPGAPGTKTASALADTSTQVMNEAQVREIARQEARAAMGQPRTPPAPVAGDSEAPSAAKPATATTAATATTPVAPPARPPAGPALQTPAPPAEGGGQAPLF